MDVFVELSMIQYLIQSQTKKPFVSSSKLTFVLVPHFTSEFYKMIVMISVSSVQFLLQKISTQHVPNIGLKSRALFMIN